MEYIKQEFTFKLKDRQDRQASEISNKSEPYMAVRSIRIQKIPGVNNAVQVILLMPDPELVEIFEKPTVRRAKISAAEAQSMVAEKKQKAR